MRWYYLLIGVIVLILFLVSRIKIQIIYKREHENDVMEIIISYLKFLKWKQEISFIDIDKKDKEAGIKLRSKIFGNIIKDKDPKKFIDFKTAIQNFRNILEYYYEYKTKIKRIKEYIIKKTIIENIDVNINYGFNNPSNTGIAFGLFHSILWSIFAYLSFLIQVKNLNINIIPNFNFKELKINFNCIFTLSIGNVIYMSFQILLIIIFSLIHNLKYFNKISNIFKLFTLKSDTR